MAKQPYLTTKKVEIIEEFTAYSVKWICYKNHVNFHTVLGKEGSHHDVCLTCGRFYEFNINENDK